MAESRIKNSSRNIVFGILHRITAIIFPFILRTVITKVLGEEYLGLNSLYASILQVLSVTELGFGMAISASMYKPIAENNVETVSALLLLYKKIYQVVGIIIIAFGVIMIPFLPHIVGKAPAGINIYVLFIIYILNTAVSYLLFAYKVSLLNANQRSDLTEKVGMVCKFITGMVQIFVIVVLKDIMLYVFLNVVCTILYNIWCSIIVNKKYPQFQCKGQLIESEKVKIKSNIIALSMHKIGNTVSVSLDTIIISAFMNLTVVAIYGNYSYIISAISVFISLVYSAITASIGNSIAVEDKNKNYADFQNLTFMNLWLVGWCSICLVSLFQNFMMLWMGKRLIFSIDIVCALVACFYISQIRKVVQTYKDAAGIWCGDKFKPLVGCIANLTLNILLVYKIGVIGVVISTIVSYLFIELPWETHVLFKQYFQMSSLQYYRTILKMTVQTIFIAILTYTICNFLPNGILYFGVKMLICLIIPNAILLLLNYKTEELVMAKKIIVNVCKTLMRHSDS